MRVKPKLARKIRELVTGQPTEPQGNHLRLQVEIPAQSVRVYRVDF